MIVPPADLRDLALRLNPTLEDTPVVVNDQRPTYRVEQRCALWVHDFATNRNLTVTTEPANYHLQVAQQPAYQGHNLAAPVVKTAFPPGQFFRIDAPDEQQVRSAWQLTFSRDESTGAIFAIRQDGVLKSQGYSTVQGKPPSAT